MKKMNDDEGYGACDEVDGPGECEVCKGCDAAGDKQAVHAFALVDAAESMKTQPVRIRVTDLARLQTLQQTDDETPGGVIHRILEERDAERYEGGEFDSDEDTIKKYESVIEKQKEKVATQRREIEELKSTINVLKSASADTGENISEILKGYEESLAKFQDQRESMLETMRKTAAEHQKDLVERLRIMEDMESELDELYELQERDGEHTCDGTGMTININVYKGSQPGAE